MAKESRDFRFGISSTISGVDIGALLAPHPHSTYFMRLAEDIDEFDLKTGDIVVVDRSLDPSKNDVVIVSSPEDAELRLIAFSDMTDNIELWGVAAHIIRSFRK